MDKKSKLTPPEATVGKKHEKPAKVSSIEELKNQVAAKAPEAPEAKAPEKKARKPRSPGAPRRSRFSKLYPEDAAVKLLVDKNPKKAGSKSYDIFEGYTGATTIGEALKQGVTYQSIAYDVGRGFIEVTVPVQEVEEVVEEVKSA